MIAALAAAVLAAGTIAFAPPAGVLIGVDTQEARSAPARTLHFLMHHDIRFTRLGAGWRLEATLTRFATDATGRTKIAYEAAMRPLVGITTFVAVSAAGAPVGPLDADTIWPRIVAAQAASVDALAATGLPPAAIAALRAHYASLATLPRAQRDALLGEFAWDLLALSAPTLRPGERQAYSGTAAAPGAGVLTERGSIRYDTADATTARFTLDADVDPAELARAADALGQTVAGGDPAAVARVRAIADRVRAMRMRRHDSYVVDRATGLAIETVSHRETLSPGAPADTVDRTIRVALPR